MAKATINLLPKQAEADDYFHDDEVREVGYGGAAGGGKTYLGWYLFLPAALEYAGSRWGIARKELKTLRMTTLKSGWKIMRDLGMKRDRDYKYNATDGVLTFNNGSEIVIIDTAYSPQDPEYTDFGGYELTGAWIDESNETPVKAKSILKTRIGRENRGVNKQKDPETGEVYEVPWEVKPFWLETFNPDKGHVYQDYYKPYRDGKLPPFRRFIPALPGDNPYLTEEYLDILKNSDKITRERLLNGNFDYDDDPTKLFEYDAIQDMFTNTIEKTEDKFIVADVARFGVDRTVISRWEGLECVQLDIYAKTSVDDIIGKLKSAAQEFQVPYSQIIADEDGVGGGVIDGMRGIKGFVGNSRPFDIPDTRTGQMVPAQFNNLRSQCLWKLAQLVNNHAVAIKIDDRKLQDSLSEELSVIKQKNADKDNQKFQVIGKNEIKEYLGRSPDLADVLMMRMFFVLARPKIIPQHIDPIQLVLKKNKEWRSKQMQPSNDDLS